MPTLDWSRLQSFVAVVEHGSLSAAARATGASQPTLSRHVSALEEEIGVKLFERTGDGLALTATGAEIYEQAQVMAEAAGKVSLVATGRSQDLKGTIRITAIESFAAHSMPEILVKLRQAEPEIAIELVASNRTENLLKREADIAVRMYRPTQNDVFTKKVGDTHIGAYASREYLARRGALASIADIANHDVVGFDLFDAIIEGFKSRGLKAGREFFAFRCDADYVHVEMVEAGFGVGFIETRRADANANLVRLLPDVVDVTSPIWLTAHSELKSSARVRRVFDFLAAELSERYG
jgi:DNA-binding transcriptional LysR family regulator